MVSQIYSSFLALFASPPLGAVSIRARLSYISFFRLIRLYALQIIHNFRTFKFEENAFTMALKQIDHGSTEYLKMVNLRDNVLRRPLGLTFDHDELMAEKNDILIACMDDEEVLGCCILAKVDNLTVRLRQMAVPDNLHGRGIGASIINFAENIARDKGYKIMTMHARDTAIGFYEKFGFQIKGNQFREVNLPHHVMDKILV